MAKRPKLRNRIQQVLEEKSRKQKLLSAASHAKSKNNPLQHEPKNMTIRHSWTDGVETEIPFRFDVNPEVILIIGDGNLSFSVALSKYFPEPSKHVIATVLDDRISLIQKYGSLANSNLEYLDSLNVPVVFEMDGTKLHLQKNRSALKKAIDDRLVTKIVFNFPHTGAGIKDRDRNIKDQQLLLRDFLSSSTQFLRDQGPPSIRRGKHLLGRSAIIRSKNSPLSNDDKDAAGIDRDSDSEHEIEKEKAVVSEILITVWVGDPYDDWNVKGLGKSVNGLKYFESFRFEPSKYNGYTHAKTIGDISFNKHNETEEDFLQRPSKTFVFRPTF